MLHPFEHVRDHQNPLTDAPALASRQAPQLGRPRFAAKEVCRHRPSQTWYATLLTLPHLEITGSRYKAKPVTREAGDMATPRSGSGASAGYLLAVARTNFVYATLNRRARRCCPEN